MRILLIAVSALIFTACGNKSKNNGGGGGGGKPAPANRVVWAAVPAEFNPSIQDVNFRTDGVAEKVNVDVFGFVNDAEVVYDASIPAGTGILRVFKVYKETATWGDLRPVPSGTTVNINAYGSYQCQIRIQNGIIMELKGGCYVRLQILLPPNAQIEVYNVGELLTKRFVPMSTENFLQNIDRATWSEQKFAAITEYLQTYAGTGRAPKLTSDQLKTVLGEFMRGEEKLKALAQLHNWVTDRDNLAAVLDREFPFSSERNEARRITGL